MAICEAHRAIMRFRCLSHVPNEVHACNRASSLMSMQNIHSVLRVHRMSAVGNIDAISMNNFNVSTTSWPRFRASMHISVKYIYSVLRAHSMLVVWCFGAISMNNFKPKHDWPDLLSLQSAVFFSWNGYHLKESYSCVQKIEFVPSSSIIQVLHSIWRRSFSI